MKTIKNIYRVLIVSVLLIGTKITYEVLLAAPSATLEKTETAGASKEKTTNIELTGVLTGGKHWYVSSIVYGVVSKLHCKENEEVKKGQLLMEIDTTFDDLEIPEARALLEQSEASLYYWEAQYKREKALFDVGQISLEEMQRVERDYKITKATVEVNRINYDKRVRAYTFTKIYSPADGIILKCAVSEGQLATSFSADQWVVEIADTKQMRAVFEAKASQRELFCHGSPINVTISNGWKKTIDSKIDTIRYIGGGNFLVTTYPFDNQDNGLHPSMVAHGTMSKKMGQGKRNNKTADILSRLSAFDQTATIDPNLFAKIVVAGAERAATAPTEGSSQEIAAFAQRVSQQMPARQTEQPLDPFAIATRRVQVPQQATFVSHPRA